MTAPQALRHVASLVGDQAGQTTVEYALLLAVFALPMFFIFVKLLDVLAGHYGMLTFIETLPFP